MSLSNKRIAVVTGAASGLGQAFALHLAKAGFSLVIADLERADTTVAAINEAGGTSWAARCNLADPLAVAAFVAEVLERHGRCDVLVNNAAYTPLRGLADTDLTTWKQTFAVNLDAAFLLSQAFAPGCAIAS